MRDTDSDVLYVARDTFPLCVLCAPHSLCVSRDVSFYVLYVSYLLCIWTDLPPLYFLCVLASVYVVYKLLSLCALSSVCVVACLLYLVYVWAG